MKIAFTSTDGKTVDQHFGMATTYHIFEVGPEASAPAGTVGVIALGEDEEDRISARANALAGCVIVYTLQIGGPAAAKLVARKIQPMKTGTKAAIADLIGRLQEVLRGTPPPWLRKAMGGENTLPHMSEEWREQGWLTSRD